jgi:hypothetical protein
MKNRKEALVIFVRAPHSGELKTRLAQELAPAEVVSLYRAFVGDTVMLCSRVNDAQLVVGFTPPEARREVTGFVEEALLAANHQKKPVPGPLVFSEQTGANLGERLRAMFASLFRQGYREVVIIGADSPTLPPETLRKAFALLKKKPVVLGPTLDGGYYLVGLARPAPEIFEGIAWGSDQVYPQTVEKLKSLELEWEELPVWYDVDTVDDLEFLVRDINQLRLAGDEESLLATEAVLEKILNKS